jgi:hypothetical protein
MGAMKWTEGGLLITESTPAEGTVYRIDVATGKKTPLQKAEIAREGGIDAAGAD